MRRYCKRVSLNLCKEVSTKFHQLTKVVESNQRVQEKFNKRSQFYRNLQYVHKIKNQK